MQSKKFTRNVEDFTCDVCGTEVKGTGYTNHCPQCLWSKHIDINPGDRAEKCGGKMKPEMIKVEKGEYIITHKCVICSHEKNNKVAKNDDFETILKLSSSQFNN